MKLDLMKQFVKAFDRGDDYFKYSCTKSSAFPY
jgi:hypothetical protein